MHTQATQQIQHLQQQVAALTSAVQLLARVKGERLTAEDRFFGDPGELNDEIAAAIRNRGNT